MTSRSQHQIQKAPPAKMIKWPFLVAARWKGIAKAHSSSPSWSPAVSKDSMGSKILLRFAWPINMIYINDIYIYKYKNISTWIPLLCQIVLLKINKKHLTIQQFQASHLLQASRSLVQRSSGPRVLSLLLQRTSEQTASRCAHSAATLWAETSLEKDAQHCDVSEMFQVFFT